jgi:hypothetical protein
MSEDAQHRATELLKELYAAGRHPVPPPGRRNSASQRRAVGWFPGSATWSIRTGTRPACAKASTSARMIGHGGQHRGPPGRPDVTS